jgi:hypothetical protein
LGRRNRDFDAFTLRPRGAFWSAQLLTIQFTGQDLIVDDLESKDFAFVPIKYHPALGEKVMQFFQLSSLNVHKQILRWGIARSSWPNHMSEFSVHKPRLGFSVSERARMAAVAIYRPS